MACAVLPLMGASTSPCGSRCRLQGRTGLDVAHCAGLQLGRRQSVRVVGPGKLGVPRASLDGEERRDSVVRKALGGSPAARQEGGLAKSLLTTPQKTFSGMLASTRLALLLQKNVVQEDGGDQGGGSSDLAAGKGLASGPAEEEEMEKRPPQKSGAAAWAHPGRLLEMLALLVLPREHGDIRDVTLVCLYFALLVYISQRLVCAYCFMSMSFRDF